MRFLITAGPTREYLDPVRFISNGSTGQMGYACAEAALKRGHNVVLISGPVGLQLPTINKVGAAKKMLNISHTKPIKLIRVVTTEEMAQAVTTQLSKCDCLIMTAAVCDYKPLRTETYKIQKGAELLNLKLQRTRDILAEAGQKKTPGQILVGFAVQDRAARSNARRKMKKKNLDMIILNGPSAFGSAKNEVAILRKGSSWQTYKMMTKKTLGKIIVFHVEELIGNNRIYTNPS